MLFLLYEFCFWRHFNAVLIFPLQCDLIKGEVYLTPFSLSPTFLSFLRLCFLLCYVSQWGPTAVSSLEEALLHCPIVPWRVEVFYGALLCHLLCCAKLKAMRRQLQVYKYDLAMFCCTCW